MDDASTVVAFYASSLSQGLGANYRPPSLPFLARWWFETSSMFSNPAPDYILIKW